MYTCRAKCNFCLNGLDFNKNLPRLVCFKLFKIPILHLNISDCESISDKFSLKVFHLKIVFTSLIIFLCISQQQNTFSVDWVYIFPQ